MDSHFSSVSLYLGIVSHKFFSYTCIPIDTLLSGKARSANDTAGNETYARRRIQDSLVVLICEYGIAPSNHVLDQPGHWKSTFTTRQSRKGREGARRHDSSDRESTIRWTKIHRWRLPHYCRPFRRGGPGQRLPIRPHRRLGREASCGTPILP